MDRGEPACLLACGQQGLCHLGSRSTGGGCHEPRRSKLGNPFAYFHKADLEKTRDEVTQGIVHEQGGSYYRDSKTGPGKVRFGLSLGPVRRLILGVVCPFPRSVARAFGFRGQDRRSVAAGG